MIPHKIYTFWFSDNEGIPENIQRCLTSQRLMAEKYAYYYQVIDQDWVLDNLQYLGKYVHQCINSPHDNKKWVKLTDYMRMWVLDAWGGWAIDADVEILGKGFVGLQNNSLVLGDEGIATIPGSRILGSAIVGAEKGHPMIKEWMTEVENNFRGDDDLCYESSMDILNKISFKYPDITIVPPDVFYPEDSRTGVCNITANTVCWHHFQKSWVEKGEPQQMIQEPYLKFLEKAARTEEQELLFGADLDAMEIEDAKFKTWAADKEETSTAQVADMSFKGNSNEPQRKNPIEEYMHWHRLVNRSMVEDSMKRLRYDFDNIDDEEIKRYVRMGIEGTGKAFDYPTVDILIPHIVGTRDEGLGKLSNSIYALTYPSDKLNIVTLVGPETVPQKIKEEVAIGKGEYICFAATDMEFEPESLSIAIRESRYRDKAVVAFNSGDLLPDQGNICEHFIIRRDFIPQLENGEIFSTDFHHVGCDNWLHAQAEKLGQFYRAENAKIRHNHFCKSGGKFDLVYAEGWANAEFDRDTLKEKLATL